MARWTASAQWAAGPALDGRRDMPLALRLSEGLGGTFGTISARVSLSTRLLLTYRLARRSDVPDICVSVEAQIQRLLVLKDCHYVRKARQPIVQIDAINGKLIFW